MAQKLTYGIRNVHYAQKTEEADGTPLYGAPKRWIGADELALPPAGDPVVVYSDDVVYFKLPVNQGYDGNINVRQVPEDFKINHLGEYKDTNGVMIEKAGTPQYNFALLGEFQIAGDNEEDNFGKRFVLYDCNASRADLTGKTKEDTVDPTLFGIPLTASPTAKDGVVKATIKKIDNEGIYNSWFDAVYYNPAGVALFPVTVTVKAGATLIAGATVVIGKKIAITNESGIARISLPAGAYDVLVSANEYTPETDSVTVSTGAVLKEITMTGV